MGGAKRAALLTARALVFRLPERALALIPTLAAGALRLAYALPRSPVRGAFEDVATAARSHGYDHTPRAILDRYVAQLRMVLGLAIRLYREDRSRILSHLQVGAGQEAILTELRERYGGLVIAVPHNLGSALYAMRIAESQPSLIVAKRSRSPDVCELYEEMFQRMGVDAVLADRRHRVRLMRRLSSALRSGQVLIATVDAISRKPEAIPAAVFGQTARFAPWAVHLAVQRGVPVVPAYVSIDGGELHATLGQPILATEVEKATVELARFLENWFARDPGSWAFLLDKRWRRLLREARKQSSPQPS